MSEATDPIQKIFISKLHEYNQKANGLADGVLLDSTPEIEDQRQFEMDNLIRRYGNEDMEIFPKFSFEN